MNNQSSDIAILLFAHDAAHEALHKAFYEKRKAEVNLKIAQALLDHTISILKKTGLPIFPVFTQQQYGNTFGEKLANAFNEVFLAGYQKVICVGSDCPALTIQDIKAAHAGLENYSMVVGPSNDGGAYLLGLSIDAFNYESFAMLNWQTSEVQNELMLYAYGQQACLGCIKFLEKKADIDKSEDLYKALEALPATDCFKNAVLSLFLKRIGRAYSLQKILKKPLSRHIQKLLLRAPPIA